MEFKSCSLIVPSVLEMTKDPNMVTVPSRYIQLEQDQLDEANIDLNSSSDDFPVINFENLSLPMSHHNSQLYQSELTKLDLACKNWGFFQLVNHGVSNSVVEKMKEEVKKLFELPIEEREKLWQWPGEVEGFGHTFVFNDQQKVNWKDDLFLFTLPHALRNPNLFPNLPSSLREILEIYSSDLAKLAKSIISQMEKVLGIENKEILRLVEFDGMQIINMINYPPCPQPEKVIGVKPHSDTVILTILLQANQVEGLQVKKDGKWVLVKPLPNAFIVNILTNGLYPSIEHRVVVNPKEERLSIATFLNPNLKYDIGPVSSLITPQNPPKYKTVTNKEYVKGTFSSEPDGKAYLDIMKFVIVPSVLEMTKDPNMVTVPSRYIQLEQDQDNVDLNSSSDDFPVINFQNLSLPISHNSQLYQSELTKLHLACKNWGFFQLVNHSVSNSVVEKMKEEVKKLFELPIEEREKLWQRPGEVEGFGHTFVFNDQQKVNWKDDLFLFILPHALRNPNLFPKLPSSLREILEIYSLELAKLAKSIISQMEKVLGLKNKEILRLVEFDGMQSINMINYPPCPQPEKVIGVKPHSDTVILTILLQANQVEGLQVKKDDKWVLVKPLPNAFIVNVGDIIEILTNGLYPSIEHRVVVNPKEERLSIATFLNPNLEYDIGPVSSLITQQNPPKYKTVTSKEYIKGVFSNEPDGKAYVDIMKLY
ncbi:hypothetical protein G4B88_007035 [Cannabis sativa]|uniref:Fe2OG dioxygenase domain-containing protein n=1 Tax=Cannabis sativa TaxID=3483 RepID=A0A7J6FNJ5_CANSA|nr:hypothetical protein G4B88_007035 [Cannabis sativa]